jgi:hypothetical protein
MSPFLDKFMSLLLDKDVADYVPHALRIHNYVSELYGQTHRALLSIYLHISVQ